MGIRTGTEGNDTIRQDGEANLDVRALGGDDIIILNLVGNRGGFNRVDAGAGNDVVSSLTEGGNVILLGDGDDIYQGTGFALGFSEFDQVGGGDGNDVIAVTTLQSEYFGEAGDDLLVSEGHRNFLSGGAGNDTVSYELRDESSTLSGSGVSVSLTDQFALTGASTVEELESIENAIGTNRADLLDGSSVANILDGRGGDDQLIGRRGNDVLDGGAGADEMIGGAGNDTYIVDNVGDVVDELNDGGAGADTVQSSISFSLVASNRVGGLVERLTLTGTSAINGTGNALDNILIGNGGANVLDGKTGADKMTGGLGDDTYIVDNVGDVIVEVTGQGTDTVKSSISFAFTGQSLENLILTGSANINATANSKANTVVGNSGNNVLDGKTGADKMTGGLGDDTYIVDNVGDVIVEVTGQGTDTVKSSISFAFTGQSLENLILTGSANINATANSKANTVVGNSGNNILDGKTGADKMTGGLGDDTYIVDNVGDVIVEVTGQGTDTVKSSISFAFTGQSLENLILTGTADINGTANSKANILVGNSGDNILDGKTGVDHMSGGLGDDTYVVDSNSDVIVEAKGDGTDQILSSVSYVMKAGSYVENLTLTGSANINATGNGISNILIGNAGANVLDGGKGSDVLIGGGGRDTLTGGTSADTFVFRTLSDSRGATSDLITDLSNSDFIDLSDIDGNTSAAGIQGFSIVDAFGNRAGQLTLSFNASSNTTTLNLDVNGDGVADMTIRISGDHDDFTHFIFGGG